MSEKLSKLSTEELEARIKILDRMDGLMTEFQDCVRGYDFFGRPHRLWLDSLQEQFNTWNDSVLDEWMKEERGS